MCTACISVFVAVLVAMIAIAITKPDLGNVNSVHPNMPVVTGLTPVMNIVLAYGKIECPLLCGVSY